MYVKNQKFLILGVSKSGYACADYILNEGGICYLYEDLKSEKINDAISELVNRGAIKVEQNDVSSIIEIIDALVISPGVPINNQIAVMAKERGKRVLGEFEFAYSAFTPLFIAVTGTNGKTTTVHLINAIFNQNQTKCQLVGNCGIPLSSKISQIDKDTVCIAEVSSFQFEGITSLCPHVACITNIAPDHLERHYNMDNYLFLKKRIFQNQKESEYTILNYDDITVREFKKQTKAKVMFVSLKQRVFGCYRENSKLYFNGEYIMDESDLTISGDHNVADALFAICSAKIMGVENDIIASALKGFKGVRHRIELVCERKGVKYFNDSKATNTSSTISAIESMKSPTVLILGGSEKGENYQNMFRKIASSTVKHVIITGASRQNMIKDADTVGFSNYSLIKEFDYAVAFSSLIASEGDCVLLSPACASFDEFSSFEERGDAFCKQVEQFPY